MWFAYDFMFYISFKFSCNVNTNPCNQNYHKGELKLNRESSMPHIRGHRYLVWLLSLSKGITTA